MIERHEVVPPVQKTSFARMRQTACSEATRIEIVQRDLVESGHRNEPSIVQIKMRDDFDAMVRLIDVILADQALCKKLVKRLRR